ncbi:Fungal specific transcription factor domain [Ceratobasidium sp. AG-Ba]|nr:Fungal specific transcription factor domain [Ceratobasidium sp. AG-Ba]
MSTHDQPTAKKRKRMHYACVECNRRKHKCDRKIPCAPCVQRGIADSCRPFEDGDEHGDLRARLGRVEQLLDSLLARENNVGSGPRSVAGSDARRSSPASTERRTTEEREEHLDGGLNGAAGNYFGGNALPSVTSTSIEAEVRGNGGQLDPQPTLSARTNQANTALRQAVKEGACSPDILLKLLSELPPKDDITTLLDIFFRDINPVRFPLPETDIRRSFNELNAFTWGSGREDSDDGAVHIIFLPLLFMIIATTTFCLPRTMSKGIDVKSQAKRYYHSYRRAASIAGLLPATTTLVCAHLLAARFLIIIRTPADGWSLLGATLRLAQALGLHRDGARFGLPPAETERRRRLWAHLFYADASMCLMLGRPMGVRVGDCDVQEPGKVRLDEDAQDEAAAVDAEGEDRVTRWTFMALRHRLAHITSRVIEHFQDLAAGRHYDTVLELDRELVSFWEALPPLYKVDGGERLRERNRRGRENRQSQDRDQDRGASRSRDREGSSRPDEPMNEPERVGPNNLGEEPGAYPFLALHRFMINTEVQYVRIALHRPYVLRAGEKYDPSRAACFEAARIDRGCREIFRREVVWPDDRARRDHMGGLYRLFNSTMILGIALLLNPAGPNAAELRGYLDDFIQLHANQAAHDVTSAREVKIIQLFRAKADDALRLRSPMKPGSTPTMSSQPPNQNPSGSRPPRSSRGLTIDSAFSSTNRASSPHGIRPRSRTSISSMTIGTPGLIDNPPLPPGISPTTPFAPISFGSPTNTTTFPASNNRRSSSVTRSPTTPREAQSLLSPAPRTVSPLLMLGLGGSNADGTPPAAFNALGTDALPFADDTQTLFDQASWQYAMANPGIGLGFDWSNLGPSGSGLGDFGLGLGGIDALGMNGYGAALAGPSSTAGSTGGEDGTSPPILVNSLTNAPDTPEALLAPDSGERVRSGSGVGKAPEGWGYWEGLVDAIVNQQGIGGGST